MGKNTHFSGQPLYAQLLKLIDRKEIARISRKGNHDRYVKKLIDDLREQEKRQSRQITELIAEVASLREALLQKDESLSKQKRVCKGLGKLISATSEKQLPRVTLLTDEERREQEEERSAQRKARKNNGSKRDMHADMEVEEQDIYPEEPKFDMDKAQPLSEKLRISIRYECVPMRFIMGMSTKSTPIHKTVVSIRGGLPLGFLELQLRCLLYSRTDGTSLHPIRTGGTNHRLF